ncbi:hypothetical protein GCM10026988_16410 [Vibrio panuliri]
MRERTALMNRIRALLSEFGLIIPVGRASSMRLVPDMLENPENELPNLARATLADAFEHLKSLSQNIDNTEITFDAFAKVSTNVQRIMKVRGIGPQTATAILASICNGAQFDKKSSGSRCMRIIDKQTECRAAVQNPSLEV